MLARDCVSVSDPKGAYKEELLLLFLCNFPSCMVDGMTADIPCPHRPVRLFTTAVHNHGQKKSMQLVFP